MDMCASGESACRQKDGMLCVSSTSMADIWAGERLKLVDAAHCTTRSTRLNGGELVSA